MQGKVQELEIENLLRTKNWSDAWLVKLRGDQRTAKAEIAVIVSQILPKGVETLKKCLESKNRCETTKNEAMTMQLLL